MDQVHVLHHPQLVPGVLVRDTVQYLAERGSVGALNAGVAGYMMDAMVAYVVDGTHRGAAECAA